MPGETSEQNELTLEERQVELDTSDKKKKNKEREDDNEVQRKTGEISVFLFFCSFFFFTDIYTVYTHTHI